MSQAYASFAMTGKATLSVTSVSSNVLLPTTGTPTIAIVTNTGPVPIFVVLGVGAGTVATVATGKLVQPGSSFNFTIGTNTYIAAITAEESAGAVVEVGN